MKAEGYLAGMKRDAELNSYTTSVGMHNVLSKRKMQVFKEDKNPKKMGKENNREELNYLKEKFGEKASG